MTTDVETTESVNGWRPSRYDLWWCAWHIDRMHQRRLDWGELSGSVWGSSNGTYEIDFEAKTITLVAKPGDTWFLLPPDSGLIANEKFDPELHERNRLAFKLATGFTVLP